ncbi:t-SNARE [Zopfia rhizophila CBS 207.26]|uniref:t-SNARE n=1 Tax=Zopfia rhizophila CBS 207.26 TaxID=1314779 RepID=A0A6A6DUP4_9PEZI|nr:t-SNARE [Zopfia rhizophila CBS 207.26]
MSYGGYQQYGGNPYGQAEGGYGNAPSGYEASNPYGGGEQQLNAPLPLSHEASNYSQASQYSQLAGPPLQHGAAPLSRQDFLARIDGAKGGINQLASSISQIANIHQHMLSSPDSNSSAQLESIVSQTQIQNTSIKDQIKFLERDASREPGNNFKKTQVENLKRTFKSQLDDFEREESSYKKRYREAIARQYRIVNPEATEQEVNEAANTDWGDEGIFQTALKSNRSGQATSVLGAVRARHNDIQRIENTLGELALLFQQLDEVAVFQEQQVHRVEDQTTGIKQDTEKANTQLNEGIKSARRARKLKWWTLLTFIAIICILGLILGLYFGLRKNNSNNNNGGGR